jgi:hypothetical protein
MFHCESLLFWAPPHKSKVQRLNTGRGGAISRKRARQISSKKTGTSDAARIDVAPAAVAAVVCAVVAAVAAAAAAEAACPAAESAFEAMSEAVCASDSAVPAAVLAACAASPAARIAVFCCPSDTGVDGSSSVGWSAVSRFAATRAAMAWVAK